MKKKKLLKRIEELETMYKELLFEDDVLTRLELKYKYIQREKHEQLLLKGLSSGLVRNIKDMDFIEFMNHAGSQPGKVFSEDYKDEGLKYITPEPPYKGDLGFKSHYIAIKDMAQPILDMFINDFKHKYKHVTDIDFNEFKYVMFMYRRDGYVHDWTFTTKKIECK